LKESTTLIARQHLPSFYFCIFGEALQDG